jgi:hypothetical protein
MKTLILTTLILCSLFAQAQFRPNEVRNFGVPNVKATEIRQNRTVGMAIVATALFTVAEIGLQNGNAKLWNGANVAMVALAPVAVVYVVRVDLFQNKKNHHKVYNLRK